MCIFGGAPSMPDPPPAPAQPAPVEYTDEAQQAARDDAREKARQVAGMAGTNQTGGRGLTDTVTTQKKTALGQ